MNNYKQMVLAVIIMAWTSLFGSAAVAQQPYQDLVFPPLTFTPPQVQRHTLPNGMRLFLVEDHELPVIKIYALIKTGSMYEPADKLGLAAITGEVLRTGGTTSHSPDEINSMLEDLATTFEISIEEEQGYADLWTLKRYVETSIKVFAEVLMHPAFDQEKIDLAKSQMLEIIRRRNDYPDEIALREFLRLVYGNDHPLARIPQIETISKITRDDVLAFYQTYMQPNNIMLAVTGDFDSAVMRDAVQTIFQDWNPAPVVFPDVASVKTEWQPSVNLISYAAEQTTLILGHPGIKADNPDYPAIHVLDLILGAGGFSSRLFQKVRTELGLAYAVGSSLGAGFRDVGVFWAYCGTRNDTVLNAITAIQGELTRLTQTVVSAEELQAAKNQYLNAFVFRFATATDIVRRQMFYEYMGYSPDFLETFRDHVLNVTRDDVLRVARTYLHPDHLIMLAVGNAAQIKTPLSTFGEVREIHLDPTE